MVGNQNVQKKESEYSYYAFISYKHADVKAAKWLQRKLQNYRLPSKLKQEPGIFSELLDEKDNLPRRLSPIFRDQTDLIPGNLGGSLEKALISSRYLIVICSKAAHDEPEYLNFEIKHFLETGHTIDQVIPFIIDKDSEHPELECFPPKLQELTGYDAVLGANVKDNGWNNAFLKVVATMLGVQLSAVKNLDDIRKRRHKAIATMLCCFAVIIAVSGFVYYDKTYVPKTHYYANYIEINGVAQGVYEISSDELLGRDKYYAITTINDIVQKVEYLNSCGTLIDYSGELQDRYSTIEYVYIDKTILYQVNCYDSVGHLERSMQYDEEKKIVQLHNSTTVSTATYDLANVNYFGLSYSSYSGITKYICKYDENGLLMSRLFAAGDDNGVVTDGGGVYGYAYTYDELGQVAGIYYLSAEDSADTVPTDTTGNIDGVNSIRFQYEDGVVSEVSYYDEDDNLTRASYWSYWSVCRYALNENYICVEISYYNENLQPGTHEDGYSSVAYTFDGAFIVKAEYYDKNGDRVSCDDGYAICEYEYDETTGREIRETYYDENEEIVECRYGYVAETKKYFEDGSLLVTYYGSDGKPTKSTQRYAMLLTEYNENGCHEKETFMDEDGNVILYIAYVYEGDNLIELSYYYENGEPCLNSGGFSTVKFYYDSRGNMTETYYYGVEGELRNNEIGFAIVIIAYDDYGNQIHFEYRDEDNQLVGTILELEYDEKGNILCIAYYDDNGDLIADEYGYAMILLEYTYTDTGHSEMFTYYDENMSPVSVNGYAAMRG